MPNAKKPPATEEETKPQRKPRRPRIDAIINAIVKGEYDDRLGALRDAIDKRNEARREDVLALVHEVYGENATVTGTRGTEPMTLRQAKADLDRLEQQTVRRNPFTEKAQAESELETSAVDTGTLGTVVRQPPAAGDEPIQEDSDGYVSRSPVIG